MPLTRESLERQLKHAEEQLAHAASVLKEQGVPEKELSRQAKWRECNSTLRKVKTRLHSVTKKEALQAEVAERKGAAGAEE